MEHDPKVNMDMIDIDRSTSFLICIGGDDAILVECGDIEGDVRIPRSVYSERYENESGGHVFQVRAIERFAFSGCTGVTSIWIPDTVASIGDSAFSDCCNLVSIDVSVDNESYSSKDGVLFDRSGTMLIKYPEGREGDYIVPDGTSAIGEFAFSRCTYLTSLMISDSVSSIESCSIAWCPNLGSVSVSDGNESYSSRDGVLFDVSEKILIRCPESKTGEYIIPNGVESIGDSAFSDCTDLESIVIPGTVVDIRYSAFSGCSNLSYIEIHEGVMTIGENAFCECSSIPSIFLPDSVTSIGSSAFNGCRNLRSIRIPSNVTSIASYTFCECHNLSRITLPDSIISIGNNAFTECRSLESIHVPNGVIDIGRFAFSDCSSLSSVSLPDTLESIGDRAFSDCTGLVSISIPDSVTSIDPWVFEGCTGLRSVRIDPDLDCILPDGVEIIESDSDPI